MRDHVSPRAELAILQLSRTNPPTKPFIPYLRASFQSSDSLHFLTSYVPGGTLADFICSPPRPPLNLENAIRQWAAEMILGLDWLHNTHRWVHRDLKPSNLLLRSDGHVVLSDFGTAAPLVRVEPPVMDVYHLERHGQEILYEHPKLRVPKRCSRTLVGTCDYIAPEILHTHLHTVMDIIDSDESQVADDDEYDAPGSYGPEVDWWSLGITLYELFYGRPPFYSPAVPATYEQIVSHDQHLRFPSTADLMPSTPVSRSAKDFISSLLSDPFERIGSGSTGISEIQSQSWFESLDWSTLRTAESAFMPFCDPIELEEKTTGPREGDGGSGGAFNFSEFFHSSPGLSVLRSVRRRSDSIEEEELGHSRLTWEGFTLLPRDCEEFEREEEARVAISTSQKKLKSSLTASGQGRMMGLIDNGFVTPKRPGIRRGTMMTRTGVRGMTDLEEWKVLVDHVMMTAQKKKEEEQEDQKETGEDDDGFDELEGRASGLLEAVDVILKRYRDLLGLIEAG